MKVILKKFIVIFVITLLNFAVHAGSVFASLYIVDGPKIANNPVEQTFYPKDISGITFSGIQNLTGYVKSGAGGKITSYATLALENDVAYYKDADGNYVFSVRHDGNTKGSINIPLDVKAAGNYDVTVNYYISPDESYTSTSAWLVKVNDQNLAYTNVHGIKDKKNIGVSNTERMSFDAGSADFVLGENIITFELIDLEIYARRIVIESIIITPNDDCAFFLTPYYMTVNSASDIIRKSIAYNGVDTAPWVVTKFETTQVPKSGETYIEFVVDVPFDGSYTIGFDKVGALSGNVKTGGKWNAYVNDGKPTLLDFTRNYKSKDTVRLSAELKKGTNKVKLVYSSTVSATGKATQDYGFFLTGIKVTPDAADIPDNADVQILSMPPSGKYEVYATVFNGGSESKAVTVMAVVYDELNGVSFITDAESAERTIAPGETKKITTPITVDYGISSGCIKLFVLDGADAKLIANPTIIN